MTIYVYILCIDKRERERERQRKWRRAKARRKMYDKCDARGVLTLLGAVEGRVEAGGMMVTHGSSLHNFADDVTHGSLLTAVRIHWAAIAGREEQIAKKRCTTRARSRFALRTVRSRQQQREGGT